MSLEFIVLNVVFAVTLAAIWTKFLSPRKTKDRHRIAEISGVNIELDVTVIALRAIVADLLLG
jgi:hypothetical protein